MLVLSRKKNESITLNNNIVIKVISVDGETVRLGIEAPREVEIYRTEIYEAIQEENRVASESTISRSFINVIFQEEQVGLQVGSVKKEDDET